MIFLILVDFIKCRVFSRCFLIYSHAPKTKTRSTPYVSESSWSGKNLQQKGRNSILSVHTPVSMPLLSVCVNEEPLCIQPIKTFYFKPLLHKAVMAIPLSSVWQWHWLTASQLPAKNKRSHRLNVQFCNCKILVSFCPYKHGYICAAPWLNEQACTTNSKRGKDIFRQDRLPKE